MNVPDWDEWQAFILEQAAVMGLPVTAAQTRRFALHAGELLRWNAKINLTAITDPIEMAVKHFLDSLAPSTYIPHATALLDIGTGGGFPGIPLAAFIPSLAVSLLDATLKKVTFVRQVIRQLDLTNATVFHGRAETLSNEPAFRQAFDTVICRAFDSLPAFVSLSHGLVRPGGRLIAMKGKHAGSEIAGLNDLALSMDGKSVKAADLFSIDIHEYALPVLGDRRALIILTGK
ncbi:MAG: 16S rRNA (guanine(527)-N(7))-methyltransferase RsmG [Thermodesulfobacteriota bacterium]